MAEPDPGDSGEGAATAPVRRPGGYLVVLIGLTVAVIALVTAGAVLGWQVLQDSSRDARRELVLQTARQAALNLTNVDYRTADQDVQRLLAGSTGDFAGGFGPGSPGFLDVVKQTQLVSTGQVTSAGIEALDQHSARVLVAVKASVHNAGAPRAAPRNYRLSVELVQRADRWLVSKVEFML